MGLLKLFVEHGICPNVLRRGNSILLLEIKECNLRFLTSNTYVSGNELELINQFNLPITKMFFPDSFLNPNSLSYVGSTPSLTFLFLSLIVSPKIKQFHPIGNLLQIKQIGVLKKNCLHQLKVIY